MGLASQSTSKPGSQQNKASKPADQKQKVADHPDNKVAQMRDIIAQGNEKKTFVPESESTSTNFDGKQPEKNESGEKLDSKTQQKMESGFGTDFKDVRVHTGGDASKLADEADSKAFAHGQDVFFKEGEYKPGTKEGDALIAHELTHTVQQRGATEETTTTNEAQVEQDANETTVGVLKAILLGGKKVMPKMRAGLSVSRCSGEKGKVEAGEVQQEAIADTLKKGEGIQEIVTPPSYINDDLKRKMAATILSEAWPGQEEKIGWIYFNRVQKAEGISGLRASTAYRLTQDWYMIWLYKLGDTTHKDEPLPQTKSNGRDTDFKGFATVETFCTENQFMTGTAEVRAENAMEVVNAMYDGSKENPYEGWFGQGSIDDFNRNDGKWIKARQYFWLQEEGVVTNKYVEFLEADPLIYSSVIFDETSIDAYWSKAENTLPSTVKKYE